MTVKDIGLAYTDTGLNAKFVEDDITAVSLPATDMCVRVEFGQTYDAAPKVMGTNCDTVGVTVMAETDTTGITLHAHSDVTGNAPDGALTVSALVIGNLA